MLAPYIGTILTVTGAITALPVLQFIAPRTLLSRLNQITLDDTAGLFFARHWGLCCGTVALVLLYAAGHAEARAPLVGAVLVEKAGFVALGLAHWGRLPGLRLSAIFDTLCCVLYGGWLLGL